LGTLVGDSIITTVISDKLNHHLTIIHLMEGLINCDIGHMFLVRKCIEQIIINYLFYMAFTSMR